MDDRGRVVITKPWDWLSEAEKIDQLRSLSTAHCYSYQRLEMRAPRVLAKGRGLIALRIREIAREAGVPIVENAPLARALYRAVKVNHEIPERLFQAVAQVLAYVYRMDPKRRRPW